MPYKSEFVPAEVFLTHNGVTVYHVYDNERFEERTTYWFTTSATEGDDAYEFDVRTLPGYQAPDSLATRDTYLKAFIASSLDARLIKLPR